MANSFLITLSHLSCVFTLLGSIYKCDLGLVGDFFKLAPSTAQLAGFE